jgi:hypothetical protein
LPRKRSSSTTTHNQPKLSLSVDTPPPFLLNKANVTEADALSQLREAYHGTGLEVRFYPGCCTIAEGVTRLKQKAATR